MLPTPGHLATRPPGRPATRPPGRPAARPPDRPAARPLGRGLGTKKKQNILKFWNFDPQRIFQNILKFWNFEFPYPFRSFQNILNFWKFWQLRGFHTSYKQNFKISKYFEIILKSKMGKIFWNNFEISKFQNGFEKFWILENEFQNGAKYFEILKFQNLCQNILKYFEILTICENSKIFWNFEILNFQNGAKYFEILLSTTALQRAMHSKNKYSSIHFHTFPYMSIDFHRFPYISLLCSAACVCTVRTNAGSHCMCSYCAWPHGDAQ